MGIDCQILLVAPKEGIYKSRHPVIGTLKFRLNQRTTFESVTLRLEGKGKCSWSETDSDDSTTWYTGKEDFVNVFKTIMQNPQTSMNTGDYDYSFEFYLPDNLPTSFKDNVCTISYKIVAHFKKPGLFGHKEFDAEIPVYGYLEPRSPEPLIFGLTKKPFSLTSNRAIDMKIQIEKTFLTPGENIKLRCKVTNSSDVRMNGIKTNLVAEIKYTADSNRTRTQRKTIKESIVENAGTEENSVSDIAYIVPTLPNLYSIYTRIFIREYKIQVTARLPFPHRDASVEIPVVIGERDPAFLQKSNREEQDIIKERPLGFVVT